MTSDKRTIRVMSYNVHSCRGIDGRIDPERICRVIEEFNPDLLALQELDVNRKASKNIDQPLLIAEYLRMQCHFQPAIAVEGEHYGIAVLSKFPFHIRKADHLPRNPRNSSFWSKVPFIKYLFEPREVVWVEVQLDEKRTINFINTHLGLRPKERWHHAQAILKGDGLNLNDISQSSSTIVCGDFNSGPRSRVHKMFSEIFTDVKTSLKEKDNRKTFFSHIPIFELDHMFYKGQIHLKKIQIPRTELVRQASDHLPIVADFTI